MKSRMSYLSFLIILFFSLMPITSCESLLNTESSIEDLMRQYHEIGQFNGAVLVSHNNRVIFEGAFGEANREWNIRNTIDTKFRLGSATKPFTAALIMKLVEEGKIDLDGVVSDYLPEFRRDIGQIVTIHHLLTHSSGVTMREMTTEQYWDFFQRRLTKQQLIDSLCSGDLAFKPGERFSYSSAGYMLLGAVIESVTGKSYAQVLQEQIFDPFEMHDTGIDDPDVILSKRASGYQTNYGLGNARYKYMPNSYSSGALYSTVRDLYKWDQALNSNDFLNENSKNLMFSPKLETHRGPFGYGWFIRKILVADSTQTRVFHAGDVSGFCAIIVRTLETNDCVVLLSNQEGLHYYDIAFNILNILNGQEPDHPREYVADVLRNAIFSEGLDVALENFGKVKSRGLEHYNTDEDEIVELGYDLLNIKRIFEAITVFNINVELHGRSPNAYNSLGEACFKAGKYQEALANYQKALELDPGNENVSMMIQKIKNILKT
jgi:CubicO group peptidase (beta-lactamase class C family)